MKKIINEEKYDEENKWKESHTQQTLKLNH